MQKIKTAVSSQLFKIVFVIILLQPILDVLSFFLQERGNTTISTLLRFALLGFIALLGFVISDRKRVYIIFYSVTAVFWILHMANTFRVGYHNVYTDTSNYLRIISLPIYALSFITFFRKGEDVRKAIYTGFAVNFALVLVFTAIPWIIGQPVYTYETLNLGVMGWFGVRNAQSAIVALLTPLTIFFCYKSKKIWLYALSCLLTMGLLFLTGTKLTFYSIFLISAAFMFVFLISLKKKAIPYIAVLLLICAITFLMRPYSPMQERERRSDTAQDNYTTLINESVRSSSDEATLLLFQSGKLDRGDPDLLGRLRKSRYGVYTDKDIYGTVYADLNSRFGVYNVMKAYEYTIEPTILSDSREKKTIFAELMWDEKDFLTKLVGFEYDDMLFGDNIYDLENDFPAIFFFCGYVGYALYLLFFVYFAFIVLRAFIRDIRHFFTVEMGAVGMTFILAIGAAQISGNVLRRPNVTIYFAIACAYIYDMCVTHIPPKKSLKEIKEDLFPKSGKKKKTKSKKK